MAASKMIDKLKYWAIGVVFTFSLLDFLKSCRVVILSNFLMIAALSFPSLGFYTICIFLHKLASLFKLSQSHDSRVLSLAWNIVTFINKTQLAQRSLEYDCVSPTNFPAHGANVGTN